ncbi:hypothetical protein BDN72DRAFT_864342 [Pluteus cervinus]|uniref:Uncharacterized protein n=1 Tax=Pluteus cervinus TaxID=181527 RepID=A0ACD3A475_9AGAR|nr:hypothetical protein BDN72DRAFT_864342 [Pluteus cervinus]
MTVGIERVAYDGGVPNIVKSHVKVAMSRGRERALGNSVQHEEKKKDTHHGEGRTTLSVRVFSPQLSPWYPPQKLQDVKPHMIVTWSFGVLLDPFETGLVWGYNTNGQDETEFVHDTQHRIRYNTTVRQNGVRKDELERESRELGRHTQRRTRQIPHINDPKHFTAPTFLLPPALAGITLRLDMSSARSPPPIGAHFNRNEVLL